MLNARRSLALSFAQKYTNMIVQLASMMLIARLLTPNELGIFAVAAALLGLAHAVRDFGVSNYLIQEPALTPVRIRTAFTVSLLMSWLMALIVYFGGALVAHLYGEPGLAQIMAVLSLSLLFMPLSMPVVAMLQRDMKFGALYWINSSGGLVMPLVIITLALMGHGYMSLAWGSVAGELAITLTALIVWRQHVILRPGLSDWRRVLTFGSQSSAIGFLTEVSAKSKSLIIGAFLGFAAAAIFERAEKILSIYRMGVAEGIGPVVLPAFSASHRSGADARSSYLSAMTYLTALTWPFFLFLALMAHPVVLLLFGHQWTGAVPIVQILCIFGMVSPILHLNPQILIAIGQIRKSLMVQSLCLPILLVVVTWAATRSLVAVALVSVAVSLLQAVLFHRILGGALAYGFGDLLRATASSALVALGSTAAPLTAVALFGLEPKQPLLAFSLAVVAALGLWSGLLWVTGHPIKEEFIRFKRTAAQRFGGDGTSPASDRSLGRIH